MLHGLKSCIVVAAVALLGFSAFITDAQEFLQVSAVTQYDQDDDGDADVATFIANFATQNDTVTVYDDGDDMINSLNWNEATDFRNDLWIFDVGSTNDAQLIIRFTESGEQLTAEIYSDTNNDKNVSYVIRNNVVAITESQYPTLVATVNGDWLLNDNQLNWNITFHMDGVTPYPAYTSETTMSAYNEFIKLDGIPDIELRFYDENHDSIPEYQVLRLLADTPRFPEYGPRSVIFGNEAHHKPQLLDGYVFWYFLFSQEFYDIINSKSVSLNFFDSSPAIIVDWQNANYAHPDLFGYPIEDGFMVKTFEYMIDGIVNPTDFETNMNWYDLANDADGFAELHIRNRYFNAFDLTGGTLNVPIDDIRYSWNQFNTPDANWDYKIGLAGRYAVDESIEVSNLSFETIHHENLPQWVVGQFWDIATFVQQHETQYRSVEGILDWPVLEHAVDESYLNLPRFLAGEIVLDLEDVFRNATRGELTQPTEDLRTGTRGEVALELQSTVTLYLSPIDRLLHLAHADFCIWDLDEHYRIECDNLNDDAYLDTWQVIEDGTVVQQLFQLENFIVIIDGTTIAIKEAYVPSALFEVSPPTNHDEWLSLKEKLEAVASAGPLPEMTNLRSIFDQIAGNTWSSEGIVAYDIVPTRSGLRFKMTITDLYVNVQNGLNIAFDPQLGDEFTIDVDNQIITIEPLIPTSLSIRPENIWFEQSQIVEYDYATMHIPIEKFGNDYSNEVTVILSGTQDDIYSIIDSYKLALSVEENYEIVVPWLPTGAGQWNLMVEIIDENADPLVEAQFTIDVKQVNNNKLVTLMSLDGEHVLGGFLLVVLIIIIGILGFVLFVSIVIAEDTESSLND